MHWDFGIIQQVVFENLLRWIYDHFPMEKKTLFIDIRNAKAKTFPWTFRCATMSITIVGSVRWVNEKGKVK